MNNEEAKFILSAYRPNGADAADPRFEQALRQAQRDPALTSWFAREQAYDAAVAEKLRQMAPPAGLREAILAGARISTSPQRPAGRSPRAKWPLWWAMAAAVAVLLTLAGTRTARARAVERFTQFAIADAADESRHGGQGSETIALSRALTAATTKVDGGLRVDFAALAKTGCRTLDFGGSSVLEVCFQRNGTWFHCYIARVNDLSRMPGKQAPEYAANGKLNAVTWADGTYRFVVAGEAPRSSLERLL